MNGLEDSDIKFLGNMFIITFISTAIITSLWGHGLTLGQAEIRQNQEQIIQLLEAQ